MSKSKPQIKQAKNGLAFEVSLDKVTVASKSGSVTERGTKGCGLKNRGSKGGMTRRDIDKKMQGVERAKEAQVKERLDRLKKHVCLYALRVRLLLCSFDVILCPYGAVFNAFFSAFEEVH